MPGVKIDSIFILASYYRKMHKLLDIETEANTMPILRIGEVTYDVFYITLDYVIMLLARCFCIFGIICFFEKNAELEDLLSQIY